jgi:hypothetical protein
MDDEWSLRMRRRAAVVLIGLAILTAGTANAEPAPPDPTEPGPATTSTSDELADMVMDVLQQGGPVAPITTPVPGPPH